MAIKRPKPKNLTADAIQSIMQASAGQTGTAKQPKSYDPNYPVFEIPLNSKVLVYVPNYTITQPDGSVTLRMDKFAAHDVRGRGTYGVIRCTNGIVAEALGLDGSCPLCDAGEEVWALYNKEYAETAKKRGISLDDPGAKDALKNERSELVRNRAVKEANVWMTFPLVVVECEERNGEVTTTPKTDAEGKLIGKVQWYSIRESTYTDKWGKALEQFSDQADEIIATPAGLWLVLNYKVPKDQEANAMNSARALNVSVKNMGEQYKAWAEYFDQLAADWTPEKAMETVVANALRDMDEQKEVCDQVMAGVRDKLAIYELGAGAAAPALGTAGGNANAALASFGATPAGALPDTGAAGANAGSTPPNAPPSAPIGDVPPQVGVGS